MLWRADLNLIYVLTADGSWSFAGDTWREGDLVADPALQPPSDDLLQPIRGFGKVWRTQADSQTTLGWATAAETETSPQVQPFTNGLIWRDQANELTFILLNDGRFEIR